MDNPDAYIMTPERAAKSAHKAQQLAARGGAERYLDSCYAKFQECPSADNYVRMGNAMRVWQDINQEPQR